MDAVVARGRATERPLELMRWLRDRLNVPPSSRSHWFLSEPSPKQVESKRFPWFAEQQSHFASRVRHWGVLLGLVALVLVGALNGCKSAALTNGSPRRLPRAEAAPSPAGSKRLIAENSAATGKSPHMP